jgi:alkylation response protein AidB-like acyl-CoA dehydrogenase
MLIPTLFPSSLPGKHPELVLYARPMAISELSEPIRISAQAAAGDAVRALPVAAAAGTVLSDRSTTAILAGLTELARIDLTVARVAEPHLDALIILTEAGIPAPPGTWGVFAAEAPEHHLVATERGGQWWLNGRKAWCSLAGDLDRALVTARTVSGRRLFMIDLADDRVTPTGAAWVARGLATVTTPDLVFADLPAVPVGADDWYLTRPGFAWGGIRVTACWAGAVWALTDYLRAALAGRESRDPLRNANLGRADVASWNCELALRAAGTAIDSGRGEGADGELLVARTRAVVADAAETVMREVGHALGPAPLAFDDAHARRVADLTLYVRQHHAERDLAALGAMAPDRSFSVVGR